MRKPKAMAAATERATMDHDPVVQGILKAISLKRLRPGMKLGEVELASAFGTHRTHIRQVLSHLGSRDLVTLIPNRGAFVSQSSPQEARAVFATRRILERAAISAAVDNLTPDAARDLKGMLALERAHADHDRWDGLALSADFHLGIARLSGNPVLIKFMEELALRTSLIIAQYEPAGAEDHCPDAHPDIAERVLARDKAGAISAMDRHLTEMEARLKIGSEGGEAVDLAAIFEDLGVIPQKRSRRRVEG